jgi:hypothetical protein
MDPATANLPLIKIIPAHERCHPLKNSGVPNLQNTVKTYFMHQHPISKPGWSAILILLPILAISCNKTTPLAPKTESPTTTISTTTTTTNAKQGHGRCKPGTPLETSGELDFPIYPSDFDVWSDLGYRQLSPYVYPELAYAPYATLM